MLRAPWRYRRGCWVQRGKPSRTSTPGLQAQSRNRSRDWERSFGTAGGGGGACGALSGRKRQSLRRSLSRGRPVGQGRHLGQTRPVHPSPVPGEPSPRQRKVPGLSRAAPPGERFRARGGAVEECGDNAPSVTAGSRRGRERRRGR